MGMRRRARERALQFLYQNDLNPASNLDEALEQFFESQRQAAALEAAAAAPQGSPAAGAPSATPTADDAAVRLFSEPLIKGVLQHKDSVDAEIQKYAHNWDIRRMAAVDRNILRLAVYEMRHRQDIPPVVSINEAVEIAKRFSTQDSGKFVNGILDKVKGDLLRNARVGAS